jgi:hypothetical protein
MPRNGKSKKRCNNAVAIRENKRNRAASVPAVRGATVSAAPRESFSEADSTLQRAAVASDEDDEDEGGAESDESDEEGVQLNADGELRTRDQRTADRAKITRFFVQTAAGTPTTPAQRHGDSPAGAGDEAISDIVDSTASEGVDEEASGEEEDEVRDASAGEDGGVEIQLAGGEGVGDDGFCSGEADSEEDADEDDSEDGSDDTLRQQSSRARTTATLTATATKRRCAAPCLLVCGVLP